MVLSQKVAPLFEFTTDKPLLPRQKYVMSQSYPIIQLHDLQFRPYLQAAEIQKRVQELGSELKQQYAGQNPLFLGVLNGAFVFAADLIRACDFECEVSFIKLSSYRGTRSTGNVATLIGLEQSIEGRHLIIVEDIVDSGKTMHSLLPDLKAMGIASAAICTLLVKPDAMQYDLNVQYVGFEIPSKFVVGYGLDYNQLGRNLPDIYQLVK
ncbi:MAG: hypoxanthine phosphoribosyltransferase [Saprospiraceae bacterium]|nr:MAG: hypoxanthine phosphoribosyltransferase [Saprospiraceae bacterium]